jgi:hypothetical protein
MWSSCTCIVALYAPALGDEDQEIDPDRWCSHAAWGQECWQLIAQWVWNLRLELGHQLHSDPVRTTEFAPALPPSPPHTAPASGYAPPEGGSAWKAGRFGGQDFALQPDGTLRCPADQQLTPHEHRRETDGSLRVVYGASIHSCRPCEASVSGVNGMAARPKSRAKSACCSTRSLLVPHRSSGEIGAAESIGVPVYGLCKTNGSR